MGIVYLDFDIYLEFAGGRGGGGGGGRSFTMILRIVYADLERGLFTLILRGECLC